MKLVTSRQMAAIDEETRKTIPGPVLMESAAAAAWRRFLEERARAESTPRGGASAREDHAPGGKRIVFVAGSGNNGGDSLVMARYCAVEQNDSAAVVVVKSDLTGDAALQLAAVRRLGIPLWVWSDDSGSAAAAIQEADYIVDGIAGTGLSGPLREPHATIVRQINDAPGYVVAVDAPSGVGDHVTREVVAVKADLTLTLGLPKISLYHPRYRRYCGRVSTVSFTIPPEIIRSSPGAGELLESRQLRSNGRNPGLVPRLPLDAHKGNRGIAAVFAGSRGTTGAAVLASRSALAAGAGLVTLFADESVYPQLAAQLVSVMVRPVDLRLQLGLRENDRFRTVIVGPGWGTEPERVERLTEIFSRFSSGVVDADGLTLLAGMDSVKLTPDWVLTPHPAELGRLIDRETDDVLDDLAGAAMEAANRFTAVVVAKAVTTFIAHPDGRIAVCDGAVPALATAGSGDVLAGLIGGLLSGGIPPWDAVRAGVLAHREAGSRLASRAGFFLSSDLPVEVGRVMGRAALGDS